MAMGTIPELPWTGERYVPKLRGSIALEHLHRYAYACQFVKDKSVLDIACGEGYGAEMLSRSARYVYGVDNDRGSIVHAKKKYGSDRIEFLEGSCQSIPLPDAQVDVVVSFETIEHITEHEKMLTEVRRVLKPGGVVIISSPEKEEYDAWQPQANPFHQKELNLADFRSLIEASFKNCVILGQRTVAGSEIYGLDQRSEDQIVFEFASLPANEVPNSKSLRPTYLLAVCSDDKLGVYQESFCQQRPWETDWASDLQSAHAVAIDSLQRKHDSLEKELQSLKNKNDSLEKEHDSLEREHDSLEKELESLKNRNDSLEKELEALRASTSWKITRPVRSVGSIFKGSVWGNLQKKIASLIMLCRHRKSGVFDPHWYLEQNPDVNAHSKRPFLHFAFHGAFEGRPPNRDIGSAGCMAADPEFCWSPLVFHLTGFGPNRKHHPPLLSLYLAERFGDEERDRILSLMAILQEVQITRAIHKSMRFSHLEPLTSRLKKAVKSRSMVDKNRRPKASIIVPVYNQVAFTLACAISLFESDPGADFELIIADDCSTDETENVFADLDPRIRIVKTTGNFGFLRNCNNAASTARGEYLVFLNNDTIILPGWLDELVHTFKEFPCTGLVGSKLLYPDGLLQEAGGILWRDGSAWNFGRLNDPKDPSYSYAREVDYCSGASIIVPTQLFLNLNGFDASYAPAYCEDSDLALKIRNLGYRVVYQPLSTVVHYEGKSCGTDLSSGVKSYQITNTEKLYKRWHKYLHKLEVNGCNVDRAKDRRAMRRVLVLDHCTPTPDQDAGSVTVYNLLLLLREMDYQATFIPVSNYLYMNAYTPQLQRAGIEMLYWPYCTSVRQHLKDHGARYDLVLLIRPEVVRENVEQIRELCPKAKVLYHTIDLHYLRMQRDARTNQDAGMLRQAEVMKNTEFAAIRSSDATIVHSTEELQILRSEGLHERLSVFPLILDTPGSEVGFGGRDGIVFVGGFQHTPNIDAVKFMAGEIMPCLRELIPGIKFHVIGSKTTKEISDLACDDIIVHGFVKDLRKELALRRVSVAPLRYGAGIKGKIGTAMAVGLPVVATPIAAEGMSLETGKNVLVADNAGAFAEAVAALYSDENLWDKVSKAGVQFAEKEWGAEAAFAVFANILSHLDQPVSRGRYPLSLYKSS